MLEFTKFTNFGLLSLFYPIDENLAIDRKHAPFLTNYKNQVSTG